MRSRALTALIVATVAPLDACAWLWRRLRTLPERVDTALAGALGGEDE